MVSISLQATGPADPETVWERYADLTRWSDWSPQIRSVDAPGSRLSPGLTGHVVGPLGVRVPFTVDTVDHVGRTWTWSVRVGPVRVRLAHDVVADPEGVRTGLRVSGLLPVVVGYLPLAQWALRRLVRR